MISTTVFAISDDDPLADFPVDGSIFQENNNLSPDWSLTEDPSLTDFNDMDIGLFADPESADLFSTTITTIPTDFESSELLAASCSSAIDDDDQAQSLSRVRVRNRARDGKDLPNSCPAGLTTNGPLDDIKRLFSQPPFSDFETPYTELQPEPEEPALPLPWLNDPLDNSCVSPYRVHLCCLLRGRRQSSFLGAPTWAFGQLCYFGM